MNARVKISSNLGRELQRVVQPQVQAIADQYQQMLDRLGRQYAGQSVETIKPALQAEWSRIGGSITDPELSTYAQHISDGVPIKVRTR